MMGQLQRTSAVLLVSDPAHACGRMTAYRSFLCPRTIHVLHAAGKATNCSRAFTCQALGPWPYYPMKLIRAAETAHVLMSAYVGRVLQCYVAHSDGSECVRMQRMSSIIAGMAAQNNYGAWHGASGSCLILFGGQTRLQNRFELLL